MDIRDLKEEILSRELIPDILSELGCHHISDRGGYYSCTNPDGDARSVVVYKNDYIGCTNYTRQITKNGRSADIFDLISYVRDCTFAEAMQFVCELAGLDFYSEPEEIPESLQLIKLLKEMSTGDEQEDEVPLRPIPEEILNYYLSYGNAMWEREGISLETQNEFRISYDAQSNYIAIPIFSELGDLLGIKGRYFGEPDEYHPRFLYLEPCNKSRVLYGYWQNKEYIKNSTQLIVVESEKSVLKLAEYGVRNVVATGGKTISKYQVELIIRTGCTPLLAMDEDVHEEELQAIADMFIDGISVYAIMDKDNLLGPKESPMDNRETWHKLYKDHIYKIK